MVTDMIQAAYRLKVLREETYKALIQIPLLLTRTGSILKTFSASVELHQCSSNLYVAILKTLEHILRYYRSRSGSLSPPFSDNNFSNTDCCRTTGESNIQAR